MSYRSLDYHLDIASFITELQAAAPVVLRSDMNKAVPEEQ